MKNLILLFLIAASCAAAAYGAAGRYKFHTASPEGGFYYDGVHGIAQDCEGFVWVSMDNELYRFDGYSYKKYAPRFAEISPAKHWVFRGVYADAVGNVYVNTSEGMYRRDAASDEFEWIMPEAAQPKVDGAGRLWARTGSQYGLYDPETGELRTLTYDGREAPSVSYAFCSQGSDVYTFSGRTVYKYNAAADAFEYCMKLPGAGRGIAQAGARDGRMWVYVRGEGLHAIDLSTLEVERTFGDLGGLDAQGITEFYVDRKGKVWMGTRHGLYIFDPAADAVDRYGYMPGDPSSLPNNSIWRIYEDRHGNVWIGTYSGKLCYADIDEGDAFAAYTTTNSGLNFAPVSAIAEDDAHLWIGTEGGGLNIMDKLTGEFEQWADGKLATNNIKSMAVDGNDNLWVAMYQGGIEVFDRNRKLAARYSAGSGGMLVNDVRKILLEGDSALWVAYQYERPVVSRLSIADNKFVHVKLDSADNRNYLFDILRQGDRSLWAISNEALYRLDLQTSEVKKIEPADSGYLGLYTICSDDRDNLWIGTIGNGLVKFEAATQQLKPVEEVSQRGVNSIFSVCYDNGTIWMGTDDGLCSYDAKSGKFMKYDKRENTQGQVYYPLSVLKGKDGKMYFGGTDGFTAVAPGLISYKKIEPRAIISEFYIDHQPVRSRYEGSGEGRKIVLGHDETNFGFEFSADNNLFPDKNMFRYRLKGYNDEWIAADSRQRRVMYSKVPPGRYTFEVCAAGNDGEWGAPTSVELVRRSAPWASLPAYILYVLVACGIGYALWRHRAEKKRLELLLYQENMEKEKKEQIHQAQLRFFTNISHDFRTPLSLIMAALDKLRREGLKEYYYRILNSNSQRLLHLVNELMDFRTVENGKMQLALEEVDINAYVQGIAADFKDYASEHKIDYRIECGALDEPMVWADKNVVEKIVLNLLNNAFKYTREGGSIVFKTLQGDGFESEWSHHYKVGECQGESFSIVVSDTGVGISSESISNVFERFYKVNTVNADSHLGTGIGLALVKSLVLLHKGSIAIYSERGKGTDMVVSLPADRSLFAEEDFAAPQPREAAEAPVPEPIPCQQPEAIADEGPGAIPASPRKILVVEDNADLRALVAETLAADFYVVQAADGVEALKLMEHTDFDLVISDIMMPVKDGVALCRDIKTNMATSHIPVILLTAKTSIESKIEGADSGADLYFEKPVDLAYLKLSVENLFRNRQQLKEHYAKNYYADSSELATTDQDNKFLKRLVDFIEANMAHSELDVIGIAEEMGMSRSKLYSKVKGLTGKSIVEFVLNCRMRRAARLIIEENLSMKEVMMEVGIESQPYFTKAFKKMFGDTPSAFAAKHRH